MKRAVMTALAVTLLSGSSALAQDRGERSGFIGRVARETADNARQEQQRSAPPPQRESRAQQAAPAAPAAAPSQNRGDRRGDNGRGGARSNAGQPALAGAAPQQARPQVQQQAQRPQGAWQGQDRNGGRSTQGQYRSGGQPAVGQRGSDGRQSQGHADGQYDRRDDGFIGRTVRETQRQARADNSGRGWDNGRGEQGRRPVIRPEDRRDRDRNRQRYDQRRYPHYVTSRQRYQWRGQAWRPPVGFYSFRWQWGQTLPWNWYTPDYYLNDYWDYGLPMPPIGCEWVRAGSDAILVDVFTGRVYQVVYDLFW
jgi:Ni/Co efflux regulator RcnB